MTTDQNDESELDIKYVWQRIGIFWQRLILHKRLLYILLALFLVLFILRYMVQQPTFTAVAVIGPPVPSPTTNMLSSMVGGGISNRLLGNNADSSPFQQFQQLLQSDQIVSDVARDDEFMKTLYYKRWDWQANRWQSPGALFVAMSAIKRTLHRPVAEHPDATELGQYFDKYFNIEQASIVGQTEMQNIMKSSSTYMKISFQAYSPQGAVFLLNEILNVADNGIRQSQLRDVDARISFINKQLSTVTQAEQRGALIQILTDQEQLRIMLVADKRFSYVLVSRPYASPVPSSPNNPSKGIFVFILLALVFWVVLVVFENNSVRVAKAIRWIERSSR